MKCLIFAHVPMEPLNATVKLAADRARRLDGHAVGDGNAQRLAAQTSGLKPEQCFIHNAYLGGGFGRRSRSDEMRQAILVAKDVGRPVKLTWDRPQDMRGDRYRPQAAARFRASLGADGMPNALETRFAVGSINRSIGRPVENGMEGQAHDGLVQPGLQDPELPRRRHPEEHASAGELLAFGRRLAELFLLRELHRRARLRGRQGSDRIPPRHDRSQGFPHRPRQARGSQQLETEIAERPGQGHRHHLQPRLGRRVMSPK